MYYCLYSSFIKTHLYLNSYDIYFNFYKYNDVYFTYFYLKICTTYILGNY